MKRVYVTADDSVLASGQARNLFNYRDELFRLSDACGLVGLQELKETLCRIAEGIGANTDALYCVILKAKKAHE